MNAIKNVPIVKGLLAFFRKWWPPQLNGTPGTLGKASLPEPAKSQNNGVLPGLFDPVGISDTYIIVETFDPRVLSNYIKGAGSAAKHMTRDGRRMELQVIDLSLEKGQIAPQEKTYFLSIQECLSAGERYCNDFLRSNATSLKRLKTIDLDRVLTKSLRKTEEHYLRTYSALQREHDRLEEKYSALSVVVITLQEKLFNGATPSKPEFHQKQEHYLIILVVVAIPEVKLNYDAMNVLMSASNGSHLLLVGVLSGFLGLSAHELGIAIQHKSKAKMALFGGIAVAIFSFAGYFRLQSGQDGAFFIIIVGIVAFLVGTFYAFKREKYRHYWSTRRETEETLAELQRHEQKLEHLRLETDNRIKNDQEDTERRVEAEMSRLQDSQEAVQVELQNFQSDMESTWSRACNDFRFGYRDMRERNGRAVHGSWNATPPTLEKLREIFRS